MRSFIAFAFVALAASPITLATPTPQGVSQTARCGAAFRLTCRGSSFGNCCSRHGYCGSTSGYCGEGCQNGWGSCGSNSPTISRNGRCGSANGGATCQGSQFGDCCRYVPYSWRQQGNDAEIQTTVNTDGAAGPMTIVEMDATHCLAPVQELSPPQGRHLARLPLRRVVHRSSRLTRAAAP